MIQNSVIGMAATEEEIELTPLAEHEAESSPSAPTPKHDVIELEDEAVPPQASSNCVQTIFNQAVQAIQAFYSVHKVRISAAFGVGLYCADIGSDLYVATQLFLSCDYVFASLNICFIFMANILAFPFSIFGFLNLLSWDFFPVKITACATKILLN